MKWYVTIKAFGQVVAHTVSADTRAEAEKKVCDIVGLEITSKSLPPEGPQP